MMKKEWQAINLLFIRITLKLPLYFLSKVSRKGLCPQSETTQTKWF